METGKLDKNGIAIKLGDKVKLSNSYWDGIFEVCYGKGTYDSGVYTYLGWYLRDSKGDSDGWGWVLNEDSKNLEVI